MGDFDGLSYGLPGLILIAVIVFCYKSAMANQRVSLQENEFIPAISVITPSAPPLSDDYIAISLSDDEPT